MSNDAPAALQTAATDDSTDLEPRDARALTEYLTVLDDVGRVRDAPEMYLVVSESGSEYLVDARCESCTCADAQHRGAFCKHQRRVAYATGDREIPAWVDRDAVDPQLGDHVTGSPRVAVTDGGATLDDFDGDESDDCEECAELPEGWPCARCYVDGDAEFDTEVL